MTILVSIFRVPEAVMTLLVTIWPKIVTVLVTRGGIGLSDRHKSREQPPIRRSQDTGTQTGTSRGSNRPIAQLKHLIQLRGPIKNIAPHSRF